MKSISTKATDPLREWLKKTLPRRFTWSRDEQMKHMSTFSNQPGRFLLGSYGPDSTTERIPIKDIKNLGSPQGITSFVDKFARFIVAILGGLSLVVPMLIMRNHPNSNKSLITTSISVLVFAAGTSMGFNATNMETLASTAAYAAVLVVFIGTSGGPSPP